MSWLFSKKGRVPKAPAPRMAQDSIHSTKRPLEVKKIKEAAGLEEKAATPKPNTIKPKTPITNIPALEPETKKKQGALYVKVDVYRKILGEFDAAKLHFQELQKISPKLEKSELNEDQQLASLKRTVKSLHDRLLQIDQLVFKPSGE